MKIRELEEEAAPIWEPTAEQLALRVGDAVKLDTYRYREGWVFGSPLRAENGEWYILARPRLSADVEVWFLRQVTPFVP